MPELPEVETVVRALNASLPGKTVSAVCSMGKLRLPFDAGDLTRRLAGRKILGVRRRAKYILVDFPGQLALLAHLGMTGRFRLETTGTPGQKHDRVAFLFEDGSELRYSDARRFGFIKLACLPRPGGFPGDLERLGPEPLERSFTGDVLLASAAGRKAPVKTFIMDQKIVVGVGNIYASEALYGAGINPARPAGLLSPAEWRRLAAEIKGVLRRAIRKGGSTIRSYQTVAGTEGGFQRSLRVYGKTGGECPRCGGRIESTRLGGRSTFFCPGCQV
ncbi:MAG: bifunctional DNA-formamidopyrimidine glycosylase/DNA-(apurinic or apyrimidinic site) lyase [Planctomycetota bacterium]|jgi:formamidopyrimidine-DNA glycosylase|nr:bifunctional DNA-formamidopyrimidine glycosylase/DNA-(apurinic or apyrimidinic site) lyase [Planctomycetota bacterium]